MADDDDDRNKFVKDMVQNVQVFMEPMLKKMTPMIEEALNSTVDAQGGPGDLLPGRGDFESIQELSSKVANLEKEMLKVSKELEINITYNGKRWEIEEKKYQYSSRCYRRRINKLLFAF